MGTKISKKTKIINLINSNKIQNWLKLLIIAILAFFVSLSLYKKFQNIYSWQIFIIIILFCLGFYFSYKKQKIELDFKKNNDENKLDINKNYTNNRMYLVWLSLNYFIISTLLFFIEIMVLENVCALEDKVILGSLFIGLRLFFSIFLTNHFASYWFEYDFSMDNILSNKTFFRLKLWNYIIHKVIIKKETEENFNIKIYERKIIDENKKLIDSDEHKEFKEKINSMSKECLEKILYYDNLPIFEDKNETELIDKLTNINGFWPYFVGFLTILSPILIEKNYSTILSYIIELSIPKWILAISSIFPLILIIWNLYKRLRFVDKRKQIDSFFFNDIKEALENKNMEDDQQIDS